MNQSDSCPPPDGDRQQISRELGDLRMQQALNRIQQAQSAMDLAATDLSAVLGGEPEMRRALKVCEQIRATWYRVEELSAKLAGGGGARVDGSTVQGEIERRQKQG